MKYSAILTLNCPLLLVAFMLAKDRAVASFVTILILLSFIFIQRNWYSLLQDRNVPAGINDCITIVIILAATYIGTNKWGAEEMQPSLIAMGGMALYYLFPTLSIFKRWQEWLMDTSKRFAPVITSIFVIFILI